MSSSADVPDQPIVADPSRPFEPPRPTHAFPCPRRAARPAARRAPQPCSAPTRTTATRTTATLSTPARLAERVFGYLPRADQRRWAHAYLSRLLAEPSSRSAVLPQVTDADRGLRRFINSSPWDWQPARRVLASVAAEALEARALTVGVVRIPKRGPHSVGVGPRPVPGLGRTVNCQLAVGLFQAGPEHTVPLDWALVLDGPWATDAAARSRARIPASHTARPLVLEVRDLVTTALDRGHGVGTPLTAELREVPDITPLVVELIARGQDFVIEVTPGQPLREALTRAAVGTAAEARPLTAQTLVQRAALRPTIARRPLARCALPGGPATGQVTARAVRLPLGGGEGGEPLPVLHLLSRRPVHPDEPRRFWLSSLREGSAEAQSALTGHARRTGAVLDELAQDFGALAFEGRSYPGWHHHMTMVSAAYLYRSLAGRSAAAPADRFEESA